MSLYIFNYETNSDNIEALERITESEITANIDTQWTNPVLHKMYKKGDVIKVKLNKFTKKSKELNGIPGGYNKFSFEPTNVWEYYIFESDVPGVSDDTTKYYLFDYATNWSSILQDDMIEELNSSSIKTLRWGKEYIQCTGSSNKITYQPGELLYFKNEYNNYYCFYVLQEFDNDLDPDDIIANYSVSVLGWWGSLPDKILAVFDGVAHASFEYLQNYWGFSSLGSMKCHPVFEKWNDVPGVLNTVAILTDYTSLIWKDRFNEPGTFQLDTIATDENMQYFKTGYWCATENSEKWMIIESIETSYSATEGCYKVTVIGRSLESILDRRIAYPMTDLSTKEYSYETKGLYNGLRRLLYNYFIYPEGFLGYDSNGEVFTFPNRRIPGLYWKTLSDSTIPEVHSVLTTTINEKCDEDSILEYYQNICQKFDIGFSLIPVKVLNNRYVKLEFSLYNGIDRSKTIVLSEMLDNVSSMEYTEDISEEKTFAFCKKDKDVTTTYVDLTSYLTDDDEENDTVTNGITGFIDAIKGKVEEGISSVASSEIAWKLMLAIFREAGTSYSNMTGIDATVNENVLESINSETFLHEICNGFYIGETRTVTTGESYEHLVSRYPVNNYNYIWNVNEGSADYQTFYGDSLLYSIEQNGYFNGDDSAISNLIYTSDFDTEDRLQFGEVVTSITTDGKIANKAYYMVISYKDNNNSNKKLCLVGKNFIGGDTPEYFYTWPIKQTNDGVIVGGIELVVDSNTVDGKQDTLKYHYSPGNVHPGPSSSVGWVKEKIIDYDSNKDVSGYYTLSGDTSWKRFLYSTGDGWFTQAILDAVITRYTSENEGIGSLIKKYAKKLSGSYGTTSITKSLFGSYDQGFIGLNRKEIMVDQDSEDNEFTTADQASFALQTTIESETEEEDEESDSSVINKLNNSARRKINDYVKTKELNASLDYFDKAYGIDYKLGDFVRTLDMFGHDITSLINEVTITDDSKGYKILPNFEKHELIPEYYTRLKWLNCSNYISNIKINYYEDNYDNPKLNDYTITTSLDEDDATQWNIKYKFKLTEVYFKGDIPQKYINTTSSTGWSDMNPGMLLSVCCDNLPRMTGYTTIVTSGNYLATMTTQHFGGLTVSSSYTSLGSPSYVLNYYTAQTVKTNIDPSKGIYFGVPSGSPPAPTQVVYYNITGSSVTWGYDFISEIPLYNNDKLIEGRTDTRGFALEFSSSEYSKDPAYFPIFGNSQNPYLCIGGKYNIPVSGEEINVENGGISAFVEDAYLYSAIDTANTEVHYQGVAVEEVDAWEYDTVLTVTLRQSPRRAKNGSQLVCTAQTIVIDRDSKIQTHQLIPVQLTDIDKEATSGLVYQYGFYDLIAKEFTPIANHVNSKAAYIDNGGKYVDS